MKNLLRSSTLTGSVRLPVLLAALALAAGGLSSCSGGGGGGGTVTPPAPTVPADPLLADLGLPSGFRADAAFDPRAAEVFVRCSFPQTRLQLAPVAAAAGDTIVVDGETLTPGQPSRSIPLPEGPSTLEVRVLAADGSAARDYRLVVRRELASEFLQTTFIKASTTGQNDRFGEALAMDGDTMVVGVPEEDSGATGVGGNKLDNSRISSGAAFVFVRDGATWRQEAYLKSPAPDADDRFGTSVAISGDLIVVGAPEEDSNAIGVGGNPLNNAAAQSGAAFVYRRTGGTWQFDAYLKPSNTVVGAVGKFGQAVAIDGTTIAIGALAEDGTGSGANPAQVANGNQAGDSGAAYVFVRTGTTWTQQAYLKGFASGPGDQFGCALDIDGDLLAVGARSEDGNGVGTTGDPTNNGVSGSGAVFTFVRNGTTWSTDAYIKASNREAGDEFGSSVALDGDLLAVTARFEDSLAGGVDGNQFDNSALNSGAVYAFARVGGQWIQEGYIKASNPETDDLFGESLALHDGLLVVGAPFEDSLGAGLDAVQGNGGFNVGAAYLYTRVDGVWFHSRYMKASNARNSGLFGSGVGISPLGIVVAAAGDNSGSTGINGSQGSIGNFAGHGAVYTFE